MRRRHKRVPRPITQPRSHSIRCGAVGYIRSLSKSIFEMPDTFVHALANCRNFVVRWAANLLFVQDLVLELELR